MSSDNANQTNKSPTPPPADMQHNRRPSVPGSAFAQFFPRSNSTAGVSVMPGAITSAAMEQRRRLSLSTNMGMGTSPTSAAGLARRASLSTNNSSDLDENAIEEEESPMSSRTAPVTPFGRRVSFTNPGGMRRPAGSSPVSGNGMPSVVHSQSTSQSASQFPSPPRHDGDASPNPEEHQHHQTADSASAGSSSRWDAIASNAAKAQQRRGSMSAANLSNTTSPATAAVAAAAAAAAEEAATSSSTSASASASAPRTRPRAFSDLSSATQPDQGFNWSEQFRSRAESTVASGPRPSFSFGSGLTGSPPRPGGMGSTPHDRARSVSEMPAPPAQAPKARTPPRDTRPKPDHFQERILKGDFYMD